MNDNFSFSIFEQELKGKQIIGYGAGTNATYMLRDDRFAKHLGRLSCFVDKDENLHGKMLKVGSCEVEIISPSELEQKDRNTTIVIVTLTDYIKVGRWLTQKGFTWLPWTVISTDFNFEEKLQKDNSKAPRLFLLNTPDYINLGDVAIAVAEELYLRENFGDFYEIGTYDCHPAALKRLQKYVKPNDIIFFQGGGNIGSLWYVFEEIFRNILLLFPSNPVIVFPQSIFYGDTDEDREYFELSRKIYNSHKNLTITVRDRRSYEFVTSSYTCNCFLLPDMVLTLFSENLPCRHGIGVVIRSDKEQILPDGYIDVIESAITRAGEQAKYISHLEVRQVTDRNEQISSILNSYLGCKLIITDRLHGMVFAAITGTPCIAFDNSYKKTSDLYDTWLKQFTHITIEKPVDEILLSQMIIKKMNCKFSQVDTAEFSGEFDCLTSFINNIIRGNYNV